MQVEAELYGTIAFENAWRGNVELAAEMLVSASRYPLSGSYNVDTFCSPGNDHIARQFVAVLESRAMRHDTLASVATERSVVKRVFDSFREGIAIRELEEFAARFYELQKRDRRLNLAEKSNNFLVDFTDKLTNPDVSNDPDSILLMWQDEEDALPEKLGTFVFCDHETSLNALKESGSICVIVMFAPTIVQTWSACARFPMMYSVIFVPNIQSYPARIVQHAILWLQRSEGMLARQLVVSVQRHHSQ